jgi:hypothetical protein
VTIVVAGGGLVREGAVDDLRALAFRTNVGVLNTWTAKGLFPWDHPAHLGTIGLQERDIELAGLFDAGDVVVVGLDDDLDLGGVPGVRRIATYELASVEVARQSEPPVRTRLYSELSDVCGPWYTDDSVPLNPARAASDLSNWLPIDGSVCADLDAVGTWIGRAFPTRVLGSVVMPSRPVPGFAATQSAMARRGGRASVAIVGRVDESTAAVMARANDLVVEVWSSDGPALAGADRLARLDEALNAGGVHVLPLGVRLAPARSALESVAGPLRFP